MSILNKVNTLLNKALSPLADKRIATPLTILLILYSGLLAGSPSPAVRALLSRPIVRVAAVFVLSVLMARGDRTLALISTVAVVITMVAATNMDLVNDVLLAVDQSVDIAGDALEYAEDRVEDVVDMVRGSSVEEVKEAVQEVVGA